MCSNKSMELGAGLVMEKADVADAAGGGGVVDGAEGQKSLVPAGGLD